MKVIVLAKQIPDVDQVKFDPETKRIVREGVPLMINSFDKKAVEEAIRLKERYGAETAVVTMGPPSAADMLNECLKMGMDSAYLLTDRRFGGSDTLATSTILAKFIEQTGGDLVLAGKYSLDGETSQVPPEIASMLGWAFKSSISKIEIDAENGKAKVQHENEDGLSDLIFDLPAVFSVSEKINRARAIKPDTPDMKERIVSMDSKSLGIELTGTEMSPTVVTGTAGMESTRKCQFLDLDDSAFEKILSIIKSGANNDREAEKIDIQPYSGKGDLILGVGFNDPISASEIGTRITELAKTEHMDPVMLTNLAQEDTVPCGKHFIADTSDPLVFSRTLLKFIEEKKPKYVLFPSTVPGREIAGRIAGTLRIGLTADCVDIKIENGHLIQYKPAFGGSIIASIYSKTTPEMATVRPGMFRRSLPSRAPEKAKLQLDNSQSEKLVGHEKVSSDFRPLNGSRIVLGAGRGIKKRDNVKILLDLANLLGASLGGTRPIVDMGFLPRQQQIGLTGLSISPDVYIAMGVSGQANHVVGIRYCGKVIAVNSDKEAPIFRYSDYGIVADMMEFAESFSQYLKNKGHL